MIFKVHSYAKIVLVILFITKVFCSCQIKYPENPAIKPRFNKILGSREVYLTNDNNYKIIQSKEEIIAYCDINFEDPEVYKELNKLKIKCDGQKIIINERHYTNGDVYLECSSLKWNLYELTVPMSLCSSNMAQYILARPNDVAQSLYTILAEICYDTDNMSLGSVSYTMSPKHLSQYRMKPQTLPSDYQPLLEIKYLKETFGAKNITADKYDNQQFQDLINFANYQFNSTIQNLILFNEIYSEFGSLLDFAWWPSLRLGNWKLYEEALARNIENTNTSYDILTGISGVVAAPIKTKCQNNFTMTDLTDIDNHKIPLYVWSFIHPEKSHNNSVVVIGFNSPFYEFYSKEDVVFCKDICGEIDWLKNVHTTFGYSTMGIMFCCSVEDVKASKRLNGFNENLGVTPTETTTKKPEMPDYMSFIQRRHKKVKLNIQT